MSIDHSQPERLSSFSPGLFKPSHRTVAEQTVGCFILLLLSLGVELLNCWIVPFSIPSTWFSALTQAPWAIASWPPYQPLWIGYHLLVSIAMWTLWRRFSLRTLQLELSLFLAQFALLAAWSLSFFFFRETLLALVLLLLLLCETLLSALLFWKKDKLSGQLLVLPLVWVFYIMGINIVICILNP